AGRSCGCRARCWTRAAMFRNFGSRSLSSASIGEATKIEEYVPDATPTNRANAKSFRVEPPNSRSDRIGSSTTNDVFTDRINTWFSEMFTTPEYVSRVTIDSDSVFSFTLSKMTTVSYSEYPRMVRMAITVAGVTVRPTRA